MFWNEKFEDLWRQIIYFAKYAHQPISEILNLPFPLFQLSLKVLNQIIVEENKPFEGEK